MISLSVVSDLHLIFYSSFKPENWKPTDLLILAGDIFEYNSLTSHSSFLEFIATQYSQVIYVLGNHEYYNHGLKEQFILYKKIEEQYPNIHVLNNESFVFGDYTFLGTTLWTSLNNHDPITMLSSHVYLNDYLMIEDDTIKPIKKLTTKKVVELFNQSLSFLTQRVDGDSPETQFFIVTHHAPSLQSIAPCYRQNNYVMNGNFVSDLDSWILKRTNVKFWVHGHTHTPFDYPIGNCRVICNPRGYPNEHATSLYQPLLLAL